MNSEKLENWKRIVAELEKKTRELTGCRDILINLLNEAQKGKNIKLNSLINGLSLEEDVSYLKELIEFHNGKILKYKDRIISEREVSWQNLDAIKEEAKLSESLNEPLRRKEIEKIEIKAEKAGDEFKQHLDYLEMLSEEILQKEKWQRKEAEEALKIEIPSAEELEKETEKAILEFKESEKIREDVKLLFAEAERRKASIKEKLGAIKIPIIPIKDIFENINIRLDKNQLIKYGIPLVMLLFIASALFIVKPQITGYTILAQEKTYEDNLNLVINESREYRWDVTNIGSISSIKASGKIKGNGTAKIYIEKDGKRYLIFHNKANNSR